jgi:hypothetical protein
MKSKQTRWLLLFAICVTAFSFACSSSGSSDGDDDAADPGDDDDDNDDDTSGGPPQPHPDGPQLSAPYWDPDPVTQCAGSSWYSKLYFLVCDPQNDLSGGELFITVSGTNEAAFDHDTTWDSLATQGIEAGNCNDPDKVFIGSTFNSILGLDGLWCVDFYATDGAGHASNTLSDICVYVP